MLTAITRTHPGNVRTNNEDLALAEPSLSLVALADGMGGHNAGEIASRLAIETIQRVLGSGRSDARAADRIREAFTAANREIFRTAEEHAEYTGMGTTLTAGILEGSTLTYASVGDSRLYRLSGSRLDLMTKDDSLMEALADVGGMDATALEKHPMRHLLTNVLGKKADLDMTIDEAELADGDLLLLSSDGLHGAVAAASIQEILSAARGNIETAADRLIEAGLAADGKDNITVVIARYTA